MSKLYSNIFFLVILLSPQFLGAQSSRIDSLKKVAKKDKGNNLVDALNELSWEYKNIDVDSSIFFSREAIRQAIPMKNPKTLASAYNALASSFEALSAYDSALVYHKKSLILKRHIGDSVGMANTYNNLGIVYDIKGEFKTSLGYYFAALKIYENADVDFDKVPMVYVNIGVVYKQLKAYKQVLKYYKKAIDIYHEHDYQVGEVITTGNLSSIYLAQQDYDSTIFFAQKAAQGYIDLGYPRYVAYVEGNIAIALDSLKRYGEAREIYFRLVKQFEEEQDLPELTANLTGLANNYLKTKEAKNAIPLLKKALEICKISDLKNTELIALKISAEAYALLGDYRRAYEYEQSYRLLNEKIFSSDQAKALLELEKKYQTERSERIILEERAKREQVEKDKIEQDLELASRNKAITALIFVTILLLILSAFIYQLTSKKKEAEKNKALAYEKELGIRAIIEAQEQERTRIAKDLHDSLGQKLSSIKMAVNSFTTQMETGQALTKERIEQIEKLVDNSAKETRALSHRMMPFGLKSAGLVRALEVLTEDSFGLTEIKFSFDNYALPETIPSQIELVYYRAAQELFNNILKHAKASEVDIQLYQLNGNLIMNVTDNGIGINTTEADKGIGIINIRLRLETIGGTLKIESSENGTSVVLATELKN